MTSACKNVAKKYTKRVSDGNTKLTKNELFLVNQPSYFKYLKKVIRNSLPHNLIKTDIN